MSDSFFLYNGFRPYVPEDNLKEYDKAYFSKKRHLVKFMTELIIQNVDLKHYHKNPLKPEDGYLFNFFLFEYSQKNTELAKALKEFRNTPTTIEHKFLFKRTAY